MVTRDNSKRQFGLARVARRVRTIGGRLAAVSTISCVLAALPFVASTSAYEPRQLKASLEARYPRSSPRILDRLDDVIAAASNSTEDRERLEAVNDFFNRRILFEDDRAIWDQDDYWATPLETLAVGRGDCEDIAIAKYYALKAAGVPVASMRLVYVRATIAGPRGPTSQAHMVVAYYATPGAEPLILDNLDPRIRPAGDRDDLLPIFSFNSEAIWSGAAANGRRESGSGDLNRWADLQRRSRAEGFD